MRHYREHAVPTPLRGQLRCLWRATVPAGGPDHRQLVVPDGCMDLIWAGDELLVAGPDTRGFVAAHPAGAAMTGLRFGPGMAAAPLGVPADELRDRRAPLAELHSGLAAHAWALREQGFPDGRALLQVARTALLRAALDPWVSRIVRLSRSGVGAADTADALGWSSRTVHRRCLAAFGYGPALLRRVPRFGDALELARLGVPAAGVAARAGYADQAHLSRDVAALAGVPLRRLLG